MDEKLKYIRNKLKETTKEILTVSIFFLAMDCFGGICENSKKGAYQAPNILHYKDLVTAVV